MCFIQFGAALVLAVLFGEASAERCPRYSVFSNTTYYSCDNGCCYQYIYPCCDDYFYDTTSFRVSLGVALGCFVFASLCIAIRWKLHAGTRRGPDMTLVTVSANTNTAQTNTNAPFSGGNTNFGAEFSSPHQGYDIFNPNAPGAGAPPAYCTLPPSYAECVGPKSKTENH